MDKTFSPSYSLSQITYVEAEAVEFSRFRFHIPAYKRVKQEKKMTVWLNNLYSTNYGSEATDDRIANN